MRLLAAAAVSWALLGGCALIEGGCPCGSDPSDPLSQHDLAFAGEHIVDDQCVCRCGDGEPVARPKDRPCVEHAEACVDQDGRTTTLACH